MIATMQRRAKDIRNRLRFPPNAVKDRGINLRYRKEESIQIPPPSPKEEEPLPATTATVMVMQYHNPEYKRKLTLHDILRLVAKAYMLRVDDIKGPRRYGNLPIARGVSIYLVGKYLNHYTISDIQRFLEFDDHTSVIYWKQKIQSRIQSDPILFNTIQGIEKVILANHYY